MRFLGGEESFPRRLPHQTPISPPLPVPPHYPTCAGTMGKFLKPGKVVIVLGGRFAGKKAVIVQNVDQGSNNRRFGHALIAGIDRYPLKVTKSMSKRVLARRSRIKPFVKAVNYNHLMPTRYALDLGEGVKTAVPMDAGSNPTARSKARKEVAKLLQERFNSGKNKWFFSKLRF
eukprot:contig_6721_g1546